MRLHARKHESPGGSYQILQPPMHCRASQESFFFFVEEVTLVNTAPKMSRVLQDVKGVLLMYMSFLICQKSLWL